MTRRARELGIPVSGTPGPLDAITDVPGVEVGYATLVEGSSVRTGVTAILPRGRSGVGRACAAGWHSLNGNGEMTGTAWLDEAGVLSLPIGITNTHAVGAVHRGIIEWSLARQPALARGWLMPVVAETYDGFLNDIDARTITPETAIAALDAASGGPVAEGSVGGGTGMCCYGFKGGTGTASRVVGLGPDRFTVGVLMQANFGSRAELTLAGRHLGPHLLEDDPLADPSWFLPPGAGSCITVIATDAPLLPGQCKALARRVPLGLARTGTTGSHFSGDIFCAFSTANDGAFDLSLGASLDTGLRGRLEFVPWPLMDALYAGVVEAVEEAVANVVVAGRETAGRLGRRVPGFPVERIGEWFP